LEKIIPSSLRPVCTTVLFLCFFIHSIAQQAKQYSFTHFTTADGLPANLVNSIAQDEEGFLWFGTVNGLSRYDGYHFLNFSTPHKSSFAFGNVAVLYYDKSHNIWVVTGESKVGIFNPRDFTFKEVDAKALVKSAYQPISFVETTDGKLLLQEYMGNTFLYDKARNRLVPDSTTFPRPAGWRLTRIAWDSFAKRYWYGSDSGLVLYNPATRQLSYGGHNTEHNDVIEQCKEDINVLYVAVDRSGTLVFHNWLPTSGAPFLHSYNPKTREHFKFNMADKLGISYHELGEFLQQRHGRMWVYGNPILAEWLPNRTDFVPVLNEYRTEQSIRFDYVRTLFEDGELNVWVATDNGLYFFNPDAQLFNNYNFTYPGDSKLHEFSATCVFQARDSTVYVSTWGPGLFLFDKNMTPLPLPKALDAQRLLTGRYGICCSILKRATFG
jgi:ligand-binding sensor domain-containing protein